MRDGPTSIAIGTPRRFLRKFPKVTEMAELLRLTSVGIYQSELLGQFRLIGDRASDVSGGRICQTQNAYAEI